MKNIPVDIVNSFHNGWAYLQLLKEQQNRPIDFLFLEVNKSFERMCGLKREEIIGKKITDLFSDSEKFLTDFIITGKQVAQDEYPQEINGYLNRFSTFCKIYISSQKKGIVSAEFQDISDNYKKEKEYQTIIQTSFDGFWICDIKGKLLEVNQAFCDIIGYTKEELLQMKISDFEINESPEDTAKHIQKIIKTGNDRFETKHRRKDGAILDIEITATYLPEDGGKFFIFNTDITKKKQAETALRESEAKYKTLTEVSSDHIFNIGKDLRVNFINQRAAKSFFTEPENLIGKHIRDIFPPAIAEAQLKSLERVLNSGKSFSTISESVFPGGSVWLDTTLSPVKDNLGEVTSVVGVSRDVTAQKNAEIKLKNSEAKYRGLFNNTMDGFLVANANREITDCNQTFIRMFGYSLDEIVGKQTAVIYNSQDEFKAMGKAIKEHNSNEPFFFIINYKTKSGKVFPGETGVFYHYNNKGELESVIGVIRDISERVKTQNDLKQSEEKLRTLMNKSPFPMVIADLDSNVEMLNERFKSVIGYTTDDFTNVEEWRLLAYPDKDFREKMKRLWEDETEQALQENQSVKPYEAKIRCKDGIDRIFSIIDTKIGDKYLVVFSDLTDRIKAEEERDRFFKVSLDLLCVAGTDGYFKQMNPAWENVLGWSIEELKSKPFFDFIHPHDVEATLKEVNKLSIGEPTIHFTNRYLCKDGSYKWLTWNTAPYGDVLYAVATDITELKNTQNEVAELNTRLNFALEGGAIGVWEWNLETNETIWDNRMEMMFGLKPNSFDRTFEAFKKLLHPDDVSLTLDAISNALSGLKEYNIIYRVLWRNGELRYINAKAIVLKDATGKNEKMIGVCLDITELKKSEEQLQKTTQELKRSNQELEQFAYIASHDLQEPLRMVSSYTQLLEKRYKNQIDERASKYIHYAVDGAVRMQNLINDLLDYSRIDISNEEYKLVNSHHIVENAIKNLGDKIKAAKAKITYDNLPEIYANLTQIERLFMNLLGNAIKFHKKNENPIIHISAQKKEGKWQFSVKDNGIGIKNENHEKVFIIFKRLHGAQEFQGTGIGLAVCKRIVNSHGGEIWFESKENEGTTFFFTLNMNSPKNN